MSLSGQRFGYRDFVKLNIEVNAKGDIIVKAINDIEIEVNVGDYRLGKTEEKKERQNEKGETKNK